MGSIRWESLAGRRNKSPKDRKYRITQRGQQAAGITISEAGDQHRREAIAIKRRAIAKIGIIIHPAKVGEQSADKDIEHIHTNIHVGIARIDQRIEDTCTLLAAGQGAALLAPNRFAPPSSKKETRDRSIKRHQQRLHEGNSQANVRSK